MVKRENFYDEIDLDMFIGCKRTVAEGTGWMEQNSEKNKKWEFSMSKSPVSEPCYYEANYIIL